jgi:hypothetical protein
MAKVGIMAYLDGIDIPEFLQGLGQARGGRQTRPIDQNGNHPETQRQTRLNFLAHKVRWIVQSPAPIHGLCGEPLSPDDEQLHTALLERLLNIGRKADPRRNVIDILEHILLAKLRDKMVIDASSRTSAVSATIGDEDLGHGPLRSAGSCSYPEILLGNEVTCYSDGSSE